LETNLNEQLTQTDRTVEDKWSSFRYTVYQLCHQKTRGLVWWNQQWDRVANLLRKQTIYSKLCDGSCGIGRPKLRFKDTIKQNLKTKKISISSWLIHSKQETVVEQWYTGNSKNRLQSTTVTMSMLLIAMALQIV